jgi:hypothetical protein
MDIDFSGLDNLSEDEFRALEIAVDKLTAVWHMKRDAANGDNWHDDQRIGDKRRAGGWPRTYLTPGLPVSAAGAGGGRGGGGRGGANAAVGAPPATAGAAAPVRQAPIESLEGNFLYHSPATFIYQFNDDGTRVRTLSWTFGIEALSQDRETPLAIVSMMRGASTMLRAEDGTWRGGGGGVSGRSTKNRHPKDWVHDMAPLSTRPKTSYEVDVQGLGRYAYHPMEVRACVPAAPDRDTWKKYPDPADSSWATVNLKDKA